jgi:hypothetical protein
MFRYWDSKVSAQGYQLPRTGESVLIGGSHLVTATSRPLQGHGCTSSSSVGKPGMRAGPACVSQAGQ